MRPLPAPKRLKGLDPATAGFAARELRVALTATCMWCGWPIQRFDGSYQWLRGKRHRTRARRCETGRMGVHKPAPESIVDVRA